MKDKYGITSTIHNNWENRWEDIVKTDQDYDGDFLIRLITHKLGLMLDYYEEVKYKVEYNHFNTDSDINKILADLSDAYKLGFKILNYNYGLKADELFTKFGGPEWIIGDVNDENYIQWKNITEEAEINRELDMKEFFSVIGNNINNWWV